ncbi:MAG: hypothetical protein AABZ30_09940 [Myxococcota bacterium]|mgnify:CR=1 FL=1
MNETDRLLAQAVSATRAGDLDGAIASLERAVELDSACRRAWSLLATIHARRGDDALARAALSEAGDDGVYARSLRLFGGTAWEAPPEVLRAEPGGGDLRLLDDGILLVPAGAGACVRLRASVLHSGALVFEVATRRRRGSPEQAPFSDDAGPLYRVDGDGMVLLRAARGRFTVLDVNDAPLYARAANLEAFVGDLHWENGSLPGRGCGSPDGAGERPAFVELQGRGRVALWTRGRAVAVTVSARHPARAAAAALVGWIGRIVPLVEEADGQTAVAQCEGEGQLLLDPAALQED